MKKFFVILSIVFVLFTFTACNVGAGEFEPTNQIVKNGQIVAIHGEAVSVNVGGNVFEFEGTNYHVGDEVKVYFDMNGEPTNPWVWWVIDCKPLR